MKSTPHVWSVWSVQSVRSVRSVWCVWCVSCIFCVSGHVFNVYCIGSHLGRLCERLLKAQANHKCHTRYAQTLGGRMPAQHYCGEELAAHPAGCLEECSISVSLFTMKASNDISILTHAQPRFRSRNGCEQQLPLIHHERANQAHEFTVQLFLCGLASHALLPSTMLS